MKCKISIIMQCLFTMLFLSVLFPASAQQMPSNRKHALQVQRERIEYGDRITAFSLTATRFINSRSSLRLSFSSGPFLHKRTTDSYYYITDPPPEVWTESRKGLHILLGYFYTIPVTEKFIFNLGSAPFYVKYEEQNWGGMYWDGTNGGGHLKTTTTIQSKAFGLSFFYGFEYFFYKNLSFNFDLGLSFLKFVSNENSLSKSTSSVDGEIYYSEYHGEDNNQYFRFSANQSKFGLAVYF